MTDAILFDLDGTLLDTAEDLAFALNALREKHHMPLLPLAQIRPIAGLGSRALLKLAFGVTEEDPDFPVFKDDFFNFYLNHLTDTTTLFPQMDHVLDILDQKHIPWGIVTNKPAQFTIPLLNSLGLSKRSQCIVCGDTLARNKPHPEPILYACHLLNIDPIKTAYIGDTAIDVIASKAANCKSLVALYGYIAEHEDPLSWQADLYIENVIDILKLFNE
jgi:N-acetyl-D-muramate 6-phosphate phosphatase